MSARLARSGLSVALFPSFAVRSKAAYRQSAGAAQRCAVWANFSFGIEFDRILQQHAFGLMEQKRSAISNAAHVIRCMSDRDVNDIGRLCKGDRGRLNLARFFHHFSKFDFCANANASWWAWNTNRTKGRLRQASCAKWEYTCGKRVGRI